MLAAVGVSVQDETACQGAFINVAPEMGPYRFIDSAARCGAEPGTGTMSCLLAERRQPARMATVRADLIDCLTASFECDRYNIHTGHPWLRSPKGNVCESAASAG